MAKGEQASDRKAMQKSQAGADNEYTNTAKNVANSADVSGVRASDSYNNASNSYKNFASDGGISQDDYSHLRGLYDKGSAYNDMAGPNLAGVGASIAGLQGLGATGGITDEDKSNIMRQSLLDQEKTGGYSAGDVANIRSRSAASAPQYFQSIKDSLARNRAVTGNLAGGQATDFKLARQGAQQAGQDRTNTEIGLADSIRAGKESAANTLSNQGMSLAGLRTGNQLQGLGSAGNLGIGAANTEANFQLGKAAGLDRFTGDQAGMEGQLLGAKQQGQEFGASGLAGLFSTNLANQNSLLNQHLQTLNSKYGNSSDMFRNIMQNRQIGDPSRFNTAMQGIGKVAGLGGAITGAFGG